MNISVCIGYKIHKKTEEHNIEYNTLTLTIE